MWLGSRLLELILEKKIVQALASQDGDDGHNLRPTFWHKFQHHNLHFDANLGPDHTKFSVQF